MNRHEKRPSGGCSSDRPGVASRGPARPEHSRTAPVPHGVLGGGSQGVQGGGNEPPLVDAAAASIARVRPHGVETHHGVPAAGQPAPSVRQDAGPARPLVYTEDHEPNCPEEGEPEWSPISPKWRLQRVAKALLPSQRQLQSCYAHTRGGEVEVWRSAQRQTAAYRGLCTCKGIWICPVCSARIAAVRAAELTAAIATHRAAGGTVLLATFTTSHTREDELGELLAAQADAQARFWRQRRVRQCMEAVGLVGRVTAQEVTYGHASGWHPHRHALLFLARGIDQGRLSTLLELLAPEWRRAAARAGVNASLAHGLDLRGGDAAGEYVAKLGLEVALAVRKLGRGGDRFGVWQLLDQADQGASWAGPAFVTYARAMKGKRHLVWSDGLKKRLGVDEVTDEDIMEADGDQDEQLFARLTRELWGGVYRNELRGELLQLLGVGDVAEARLLLREFGLDPSGLHTRIHGDSMMEDTPDGT